MVEPIDPERLARLERHAIADGVSYAEVAEIGGTTAGIIWHDPGAVRPRHSGTGLVHAWVVSGGAHLDGRLVSQGTYYALAAGERPEVRAGPDGYVVYFVALVG